jgi:hypothetical protein
MQALLGYVSTSLRNTFACMQRDAFVEPGFDVCALKRMKHAITCAGAITNAGLWNN